MSTRPGAVFCNVISTVATGRLRACPRVGRRRQALVRATGDHRLPGRMPRPPSRGHAAHRGLGRGRGRGAPACDELSEFSPAHAGMAFHELGEVRLRMGDLEGADEAFRRAHELGEDPQPGLTISCWPKGRSTPPPRRSRGAWTSSRGTSSRGRACCRRRREIALAGRARARAAAEELDAIAEEFGTTARRPRGERGSHRPPTWRGRPADAVREAPPGRAAVAGDRCAVRGGVGRPPLAEAYSPRATGRRPRSGAAERASDFERLGAVPDARRAAETLDASQTAGRPR